MNKLSKKYLLLIPIFLCLGFLFFAETTHAQTPPAPSPTYTTTPGRYDNSDPSYATFRGNGYVLVSNIPGSSNVLTQKYDGNNYLQQYYAVDPSGHIVPGSYVDETGLFSNGISKQDAQQEIDALYGKGTFAESVKVDVQQGTTNAPPYKAQIQDCVYWPDWYTFQLNADVCIARFIANPLLKLSSRILWIAGFIFNYTLSLSLNMTEIINKTPVVRIGWKILRDVANLCFIFILIAIAIGTILQVDSYDVKKLLAKVIVVAIILNFSLFLTKVVIDSSNIIALQFYSKIAPNPTDYNAGISAAFIRGLGLESLYTTGSSDLSEDAQKNVTDSDIKIAGVNVMSNVIYIGIFGSILILITAFVLLVGMILFIIRTIVLMFLMVLSPLAFLSSVLPGTKKHFDRWLSALLNQSFFAPLFLLMIYIVIASIGGRYTEGNFANLLAGNGNSITILYSFVILIGLMLGSLIIAKTLGAVGGDFARNTAGRISLGTAGFVGRNTAGRISKRLQDTALVKRYASSKYGSVLGGRAFERGLNKAATGSFDARNIGVFGKATGLSGTGKGGFAKGFEERKKTLKEQMDRVSAPSAREEDRMDAAETKRDKIKSVQAGKLIEEREALEREKRIKESEKQNIEANPERQKAIDKINHFETVKREADKTFNEKHSRFLTEIEAAQAAGNATAKKDAQERLKIEEQKHANEQRARDIEIADQKQVVQSFDSQLAEATKQIGEFGTEIAKKDNILSKLNKDYNKDGVGN